VNTVKKFGTIKVEEFLKKKLDNISLLENNTLHGINCKINFGKGEL
jgi:hypothetical protein